MSYMPMKLNYFEILDLNLEINNFIKFYLINHWKPSVVISKGNQEIKNENICFGKNILDACLKLSTKLNDNICPFPQYNNGKMRNKSLDMIVLKNYEIYFYKLGDDSIL